MQNLKKTLERKTERHYAKLSKKQITDQSFKKACDINNIVKQFTKSGKLPVNTKVANYGDYSETPTLEMAFEIAQMASDQFMTLPAEVRRLMDNDASQLENFISDEGNKEICLKYGLLEEKAQVIDEKPVIEDTSINNSSEGA